MSEALVLRHKTALHRVELSRPLRVGIEDGLVSDATTVFDYGCGHGGDLKQLRRRGIASSGWDPAHRPNEKRTKADVVNLGYVVNVIERPRERVAVLREAWELTDKVLILSAQLDSDKKSRRIRPHEDGYLTGAGTFQKYFTQAELRDWVEGVLGVPGFAGAPGILYVFRDDQAREEFAASRFRRVRTNARIRQSDRLLEENRDLLEPLIQFLNSRGRLPASGELKSEPQILEIFGSIRRAGLILKRAIGTDGWEKIRRERREDLLLYLALARFSRRPRFSALPPGIRNDVKAFFRNYKRATGVADFLLYSLGNLETLNAASRLSPIGKKMPTAIYVHSSGLEELPLELRLYEGCARTYLGDVEGANIVKLNLIEPKVSYLSYKHFERAPHPKLLTSTSVSLQTFRVRERSYADSSNPPILHRKEDFVPGSFPGREKFERLTRQEERFGLYTDTTRIGTQEQWELRLAQEGVYLRGHRVVRSR